MSTSPPGSRHSQASLSPNNSQTNQDIDVPLETLVSHLLASKRSLSSISSVLRANEIVTSARSAVEESIILESRTAFLRRGISQQARILRKVRNGVDHVFKEGERDFQETLRSLDAADNRLKKTMEVLRSTIVDAAFRPANEEPRSLLYFVDEAGVETTRSALRYCIDQSQVCLLVTI
jgi:autophagy-related protein 17